MIPFLHLQTLEAFNKKIIDGESVRLHMVRNPKELKITNLPSSEFHLSNHPTMDLGKRTVNIDNSVMIEGEDAKDLKNGESIRLLGIGIFKITDSSETLLQNLFQKMPKILKKKYNGLQENQ